MDLEPELVWHFCVCNKMFSVQQHAIWNLNLKLGRCQSCKFLRVQYKSQYQVQTKQANECTITLDAYLHFCKHLQDIPTPDRKRSQVCFLSGNFQSFPECLVGVLCFSRRRCCWKLQLPSVLMMLQRCLSLKPQPQFCFPVLNLSFLCGKHLGTHEPFICLQHMEGCRRDL